MARQRLYLPCNSFCVKINSSMVGYTISCSSALRVLKAPKTYHAKKRQKSRFEYSSNIPDRSQTILPPPMISIIVNNRSTFFKTLPLTGINIPWHGKNACNVYNERHDKFMRRKGATLCLTMELPAPSTVGLFCSFQPVLLLMVPVP